jgi:CubicO group peptidase (beta-lactamase class C family)
MEVAGILISRISGQPLSEFVEERLLRPLHMYDTGFWVPEAKKTRLATCYGFALDGRLAPYQWPSGPATEPPKMESGGGGLFSTADDFCRFGLMLINDGEVAGKRVLSSRSVAAMRSDQVAALVKQASPFFPGFWNAHSWGLGMAVGVRADSISGIGGFGWWGGTGTTFFANPARSKVAVLLSQRMMTRPDDTAVGDAFVRAAFAG